MISIFWIQWDRNVIKIKKINELVEWRDIDVISLIGVWARSTVRNKHTYWVDYRYFVKYLTLDTIPTLDKRTKKDLKMQKG